MSFLTALLSLLDKNLNLILLWLYNKKVDENAKLEIEVRTVKEETEVAHKEESLAAQKLESDSKVLAFRRKLKEYKGEQP